MGARWAFAACHHGFDGLREGALAYWDFVLGEDHCCVGCNVCVCGLCGLSLRGLFILL